MTLATIIAIALLLAPHAEAASAPPTSQSFTISVAEDGSAVVVQTFATSSDAVSVSASLLTPIFSYLVVTDQNGSPLQYQVAGSNVTVYTLGATSMKLQYYTDALTNKQGTVWTLNFTTPYNSTVALPPGSTVISVSGTPASMSQQGTSPVLTLNPGSWQVEYGVPVTMQSLSSTETSTPASSTSSVAGQTTSSSLVSTATGSRTSSSMTTTTAPASTGTPGYLYVAAAVVAAAVIGVLLYLRRRGSGIDTGSADLRPDDVQVLNFIAEKGGKVFESDIRTRFVLPKTSTWRQIKRLERLGYVKITKVGALNQVELVKNREKQA